MKASFVTLIASAIGTLASPVNPRVTYEFLPKDSFTYDVGNGKISCDPDTRIFKHWNNRGHDITTLSLFEYPADVAGKTCQFGFELNHDDILTGSKKFDLFSTLRPTTTCPATSWPPNNNRDQHLGRMTAAVGAATWDMQFLGVAKPGPCPKPGTVVTYELVGVYDVVEIDWNAANGSGPRIYYW